MTDLYPPAPWLYPNKPILFASPGIIAAGAASTLIPAVAGQQIYLFVVALSVDAAVVGDSLLLYAQTSSHAQLWQQLINTLPLPPQQFYGAKCGPVGDGLEVKNNTAGNVTVRGYIV